MHSTAFDWEFLPGDSRESNEGLRSNLTGHPRIPVQLGSGKLSAGMVRRKVLKW